REDAVSEAVLLRAGGAALLAVVAADEAAVRGAQRLLEVVRERRRPVRARLRERDELLGRPGEARRRRKLLLEADPVRPRIGELVHQRSAVDVAAEAPLTCALRRRFRRARRALLAEGPL